MSMCAQTNSTAKQLSLMLDGMCRQRKGVKEVTTEVTVYDAQRAPGITVEAYVDNWVQQIGVPDAVFRIVRVYIERFTAATGLKLSRRNVHRVVLACLVIAIKWSVDDRILSNSVYSKVGGVSRAELARLERAFLTDIEWNTHVSQEECARHSEELAQF